MNGVWLGKKKMNKRENFLSGGVHAVQTGESEMADLALEMIGRELRRLFQTLRPFPGCCGSSRACSSSKDRATDRR